MKKPFEIKSDEDILEIMDRMKQKELEEQHQEYLKLEEMFKELGTEGELLKLWNLDRTKKEINNLLGIDFKTGYSAQVSGYWLKAVCARLLKMQHEEEELSDKLHKKII